MSKLPPLPHWCESGSPFAEQMQAYATAAIEPLLQRIAELEKERDEWKHYALNGANAQYLREKNAELKRQFEEAQKQINKLEKAHESTIYLYSLPK